jgi:hypothetical protein
MNSNWRKCLGEVLSRFYQLGLNTIECHEDVSRWNAPSECHGDVNRGYDDAVEKRLRKSVCSVRHSKHGRTHARIPRQNAWIQIV